MNSDYLPGKDLCIDPFIGRFGEGEGRLGDAVYFHRAGREPNTKNVRLHVEVYVKFHIMFLIRPRVLWGREKAHLRRPLLWWQMNGCGIGFICD